MSEGSYYQKFDTRKVEPEMDDVPCGSKYDHDPHVWRWTESSLDGAEGINYRCPGAPLQGEKELVAAPVEVTNEHRGGVTIEWPGGKVEPEWCDARERAVALELALKWAEKLDVDREAVMETAGEFFLFIVGEGRDSNPNLRDDL